tara:strand:- start:70 stop:621 length:552 start_codon:yes stop_codon:yes gene_type:complete
MSGIIGLPNIKGSGVIGPGSGTIIQIIQSTKSDTSERAYPSFNNIPGTDQSGSGSVWCVKITPSATSSKILFIATIMVGSEQGNASAKIKLLRDSTDIAIGNAISSNERTTHGDYGINSLDMRSMSMTYLDSPSSTAELTYKPQYRSESSTYSTWVNRPHNQTDSNVNGYTGFSTLTVMEVAG